MRNKVSNILWGLAFIIVGLGFAGNAFGVWDFRLFFNGWWTLFIIVPSILSIVQNGPRPVNIIGVCVGVLLLLAAQGYVNGELVGDMIVPVILIIIGLGFLFKTTGAKNSFHREFHGEGGKMTDLTAIFGGRDARYQNEIFEGATVNAIFGGVELDLRGAIIKNDIEISATAIFGGIDIFIPSGVKVKVSSIPIFGGVSNKTLASEDPNAPVIYVNATCMFGGVDIK